MKKIYSLLSLCILFLSCEQDEVINNEPNQENSNTPEISSIKFEEVPQNIINQFYSNHYTKASNSIGTINKNRAVQKVKDTDGNISYTFLLGKNTLNKKAKGEDNSFYNLVITNKKKLKPLY